MREVSSLISKAGSSNIDVRLASCDSRCSLSAVAVIPALMRLAREMNSDLCAMLPGWGAWVPVSQNKTKVQHQTPPAKRSETEYKQANLHSPVRQRCLPRPEGTEIVSERLPFRLT